MSLVLSEYVAQTRELLHDERGNFYSTAKIQRWVNRGRRQCAADNQCVRYMPAATGFVLTATITNPGSGYTSITLTVSSPDGYGGTFTRAVLTPTLLGGALTAVSVTTPGTGYVAIPTVTVSGVGGTGAAVVLTLSPRLATIANQEVYTYASAAAILDQTPGLAGIIGVQGISISWGATKPTLDHIDWSTMQAYLRAQSTGTNAFPSVWAQYGQGELGSVYLWPRPATVSQMEWDCYCNVSPLVDDTSPDLIPHPWDEAVPYYAASLAFLFSQRFDDSRGMLSEFTRKGQLARLNTSPSIRPSMYE